MARRKPSGFSETVRTIAWAVAIALVVRTFGFEPFNIPSGSMYPTLMVGDYLFVSKFSYGFSRYSLPFGLPLIPGRMFFDEPERGDVAVFKMPRDNKTDYIKRIIGLPGDRIQLRDGRLVINGQLVKREPVGGEYEYVDTSGRLQISDRFRETLPNGRSHQILEVSDNQPYDNTQVFTVPDDKYFAMGDNRDRSRDSRYLTSVGFVPKENLVGRAEVIFFSTNGEASLWEFWKWPSAIRFGRLFMGIE